MRSKFLIILGVFFLLTKKTVSQVDLQTGAAEINIPLYSYSDPNNRLAAGIALVYTSGNGIKVSEVASSIGAGWNLATGGVITRVQNGEPDDQKQNGSFSYPTGGSINNSQELQDYYYYRDNYYPNGYIYSEFNPTSLVNNAGGYTPQLHCSDNLRLKYRVRQEFLADTEQDVFEFSFNGRAGRFVIGRNGVIKQMIDSRLVITKDDVDMTFQSIRTRISEFTVTDESGIKYIFKELELSQVLNYDSIVTYNCSNNTPSYIIGGYACTATGDFGKVITGRPINQYVVNKWYLSEIVNPITSQKILFQYEAYNVDMYANKISSQTEMNNQISFNLIVERSKGISKRLSSIICSSKEKVDFVYSATNRKDLQFDKSLDEIQIKYDNTIKYKWKFNSAYFAGTYIKQVNETYTSDELKKVRLCLTSFQKFGSNGSFEPPYIISYADESGDIGFIPSMFSVLQDHWGYTMGAGNDEGYENTINSSMICQYPYSIYYTDINSYFSPLNSQAAGGLVKSIQYPLKGILRFEYEQNKALKTIPVTQEVSIGGVRVKKTILFDGIDHSKDIITEYKYLNENGLSSGVGYEDPIFVNTETVRVWQCANFNNKTPGSALIQGSGISLGDFGLSLASGSTVKGAVSTNAKIGMGPNYLKLIKAFAAQLAVLILTDVFSPDYKDYQATIKSLKPLNYSNSLPFYYSSVEIVNKSGTASLGKTVYEFTSPLEYPFEVGVQQLAFPYSNKPRTAYWLYGLPKRITVSDNAKWIKKIENYYQAFKTTISDVNFASQKWQPHKRLFGCSFQLVNITGTDEITHDIYYPIYGRVELTQTKEYFNNDNNQFTLVTTDFEYSSLNYQVKKVKTTNSQGELIESNTYYPDDYTLGGVIQEMKNRNIVNVPISSQTLITKTANQKYLTGGSVSEYSIISNGDIKPFKTYSFRSDQPIIENQIAFSASQLIPNNNYYKSNSDIIYYKQVGTDVYNAGGLPIQVNSESGKASIIYDYNNQFSIATVSNASIEDIAYTSFEADGTGGWNLTFPAIIEDYSPTGKKCLKFFSIPTSINKSIDNPKSYILSFWSKNGVPFVFKLSGASPQPFSPVKTFVNPSTGWTYYEYTLTNTSVIYIDNSLNGTQSNANEYYVDELRLYPSTARMSTVTYDPMVGKTTECDANNHITFYEYDDMGRLKIIRDEKRNVIKAYEYNYKQ